MERSLQRPGDRGRSDLRETLDTNGAEGFDGVQRRRAIPTVTQMKNSKLSQSQSFLTSSGVSDGFQVVREILAKPLDGDHALREQLTSETQVMETMNLMFERHIRLHLVLAGWIDQAILEYHSQLQGDVRCLPKMLEELNLYRADQNGDICFYLAELHYNEVVATMVSFEDATINTKEYRPMHGIGSS